MDAVSIGVLRKSGKTVANLISSSIKSKNSVGVGVAVGAESGEKGALSAGGVAGTAGKGSVRVDDLVEASGADTLSIDEGPVVAGDAGGAGRGGVAGQAEG